MATKTDNTDALTAVLGSILGGRTVYPEDARRIAAAAGISDEDLTSAAQVSPFHTIEWEDANTRHGREYGVVAEHLVRGEVAADAALADSESFEAEPVGTGSNDPADNALATGGTPFENVSNVGFSGQVIDAAEYKPEDDDTK